MCSNNTVFHNSSLTPFSLMYFLVFFFFIYTQVISTSVISVYYHSFSEPNVCLRSGKWNLQPLSSKVSSGFR